MEKKKIDIICYDIMHGEKSGRDQYAGRSHSPERKVSSIGANCQTVYPERKTQREAAIEAVRNIGLRQIKDIDEEIFEDRTEWKVMFFGGWKN